MTGTDRMVVWLREAMDAAQADAEAATWCEDAGTWRAAVSEYGTPARAGGPRWYIEDAMDDGVITTVDPQASADEGVARHIARQDPAAVLRRIAADRKILAAHPYTTRVINPVDGLQSAGFGCETCHDWDGVPEGRGWCDTVRLLAEGYGWTEGE
jgi:hypothetical protein